MLSVSLLQVSPSQDQIHSDHPAEPYVSASWPFCSFSDCVLFPAASLHPRQATLNAKDIISIRDKSRTRSVSGTAVSCCGVRKRIVDGCVPYGKSPSSSQSPASLPAVVASTLGSHSVERSEEISYILNSSFQAIRTSRSFFPWRA